MIGPVPLPLATAVTQGVHAVGTSVVASVQGIGHVFGPGGIRRISTLLFTDAPREQGDATTVIGIGQQVGDAGGQGDFLYPLWLLAFVTVFIGLVNLVPLPPFDGGHLFVLLVEKIRGRAIDMRAEPALSDLLNCLTTCSAADFLPKASPPNIFPEISM